MVSIRRSIRRTSRIRLIPVLFVAVLGMGVAKACYYQALNLENPADYYYRYCYAGVSRYFELPLCPSACRILDLWLVTTLTPVYRRETQPTRLYCLLHPSSSRNIPTCDLRQTLKIPRSRRDDL